MNVYIEGRVRNKKLVHNYVDILLHILKIDRLNRDLEIKFVTECDGQALGYCWGDSDEVTIQISRMHYNRKLSFIEMMKSLTHEMVHARQIFRKQLTNNGVHRTWNGQSADHYSYEESPWEKEAYELEEKLFKEWFPFHASFQN